MKKLVFSRKKVLVMVLISICIVSVFIGVFLICTRKVVFYREFIFRKVTKEYKAFSRELYSNYSNYINKLLVAQDSRSKACIRFVFLSDMQLDSETIQRILSDILLFELSVPITRHSPALWEVYFCCNKQLYSAYVTPYTITSYGIVNYIDDWYTMPDDHVKMITFDTIKRMLKRTALSIYHLGSPDFDWQKRPQFPIIDQPVY